MKLFSRRRRPFIVTLALLVFVGGIYNAYQFWADKNLEQQQLKQISNTQQEIRKIKADYKARLAAELRAQTAAAARIAEQETGLSLPSYSSQCNKSKTHADPYRADVLVNKKHCIVPLNFTPELVTIANGAAVSKIAADDLTSMMNAALAAGLPLGVTSSFRSYESQAATYQHWIAANGSQDLADTVSARPGFSEHQTGLVVDLAAGGCGLHCFTNTAHRQWLLTHAHEFGWIERYPVGKEAITGYDAESWHYRYVGKQTATAMKTKNITTLEEYWKIEGGDYEK